MRPRRRKSGNPQRPLRQFSIRKTKEGQAATCYQRKRCERGLSKDPIVFFTENRERKKGLP
jgi:hypothetical protein